MYIYRKSGYILFCSMYILVYCKYEYLIFCKKIIYIIQVVNFYVDSLSSSEYTTWGIVFFSSLFLGGGDLTKKPVKLDLLLEAPFTKVFWAYLASTQTYVLFFIHIIVQLKRKKCPLFKALETLDYFFDIKNLNRLKRKCESKNLFYKSVIEFC